MRDERSIVTDIDLNPGFFVPPHLVALVLVPYGLYLLFSSYLCPLTCLPSWLPLASMASFLGTQFKLAMGLIILVTMAWHAKDAVLAWHLANNIYHLSPPTVAVWILSVVFFGIFGYWPLAFPDIFFSVSDTYCKIPGAICFNIQ